MSRLAVNATIVAPHVAAGQVIGPTIVVGPAVDGTVSGSGYLDFDTTLVPDTATLVAMLDGFLNTLQTNGSIPSGSGGSSGFAVIDLSSLPTTLPSVSGVLWNNGGILQVS